MSKIKHKTKPRTRKWLKTAPPILTGVIRKPNFIRSLSQIKTWHCLWYMFYKCFQVKIPSDFHMLKMMAWEISNNAAVIKLTIHSLLLAARIKLWKSVLVRLSIRISFEEVILYLYLIYKSSVMVESNQLRNDVNLPSV